jgi:uncharacterized protein YdaU (DUF1376 family)
MADELPEPLVGPHVDCSDLDSFMLNTERLMASELLALNGNEVLGAALLLWCRAWKQRPAASLPDDDRVNAAFARLSLAKFRQMKEGVMRGFIKCSDGRLYHRVLAQEAIRSYAWKITAKQRRERDAERLRKWRSSHDETSLETHPEARSETRFAADGNGKEVKLHISSFEGPSSEGPKKSSAKGKRLPPDWKPSDTDWNEACRLLGRQKAELELAKFRDYWPDKPGKDGLKIEWNGTWRNWVRKAAEQPGGRTLPSQSGVDEPSLDLGGEFHNVPLRNLQGIVKRFAESGTWPFPTPRPGEHGCRVPLSYLPAELQPKPLLATAGAIRRDELATRGVA